MKGITEGNQGRHTDEQKLLPWDLYLISCFSVLFLSLVSCDALVLSSGRISDNHGFAKPMMSFLVLLLMCLFLVVSVNHSKQL